jgi:XisH protein
MAKDKFHDHVREALEKDGRTITAEQFRIELDETYMQVDI